MELSPLGRVGFELAARAHGSEPRPSPIGENETGEIETRARAVAERLALLPEESRRTLLSRLCLEEERIPWARVHPTWIRPIVESLPRQWKVWAHDALPAKTRAKTQSPTASSLTIRADAPPTWWTIWFERLTMRGLDLRLRPSWDRSAQIDAVGELANLSEGALRAALVTQGLIGFVSRLRGMPRADAQALLWQVPSDLQPIAGELVAAKKWVEDPFWTNVFDELALPHARFVDRLSYLGLADVVRGGLQANASVELRRLALALSRPMGTWLLEQIASRPDWSQAPVRPDLEQWMQRLRDVMRTPAASVASASDEGGPAE